MDEPIASPEFEGKVREAMSVADADPAFKSSLRARLTAVDAGPAARRHPSLRLAPALIVGALILALAGVLIAGPQNVASAMRRLLGYIPGIGLVNQEAPIRVLAEPVTQTRDGITLTVEQAVLDSAHSVVVFKVDGIPWSAFPHREDAPFCAQSPYLRLPDGARLEIASGGGPGWGAGYGARYVFPAVPANVNEATFVMPCLQGTSPGSTPEDWEAPLHFVPAPPDMTVMPVIEVSPSPSAAYPLTLEKVVETQDGYIFMGAFNSAGLPNGGVAMVISGTMRFVDASGNEIYAVPAGAVTSPPPGATAPPTPYETTQTYTEPDVDATQAPGDRGALPWAYEIKGKQLAWPLTIILDSVEVMFPDARGDFLFDTGPDPQPGQVWTLNRDLEVGGYGVRVASARRTERGYEFTINADARVHQLGVDIRGATAVSGEGGSSGSGNLRAAVYYADEPPSGVLTVVVSGLWANVPGPWQVEWAPTAPTAVPSSLYGISLTVDRYIPLDDGYYLIGHTDWTDERITSAGPGGYSVEAFDGAGQKVAIEPAPFSDIGIDNPEPNQWVYKVYGRSFSPPLTLRATLMGVEFKEPVTLTLDLRSYGFDGSDSQLGMVWKTGLIPLEVPGLLAHVSNVKYVKQGGERGFEIGIRADPRLQSLGFSLESPVTPTGNMVGVGGGSNRDESSGLVLSYVLTDAKVSFPIVLSASGAGINGDWETTWSAPAMAPGPTVTPVAQACLTLDGWKAAAAHPAPLPEDLSGRLVVYGRVREDANSPSPDNYGVFVADLDGSNKQVQGPGTWPSLSPDGTRSAYSGPDALHVVNLASGENRALPGTTANDYAPRWSPDGGQIAFVRSDDLNLYVISPDGSGSRRVTSGPEYEQLLGWSADGALIYYTVPGEGGQHLRSVDVATGHVRELFVFNSKGAFASISPDGQRIAFVERVPGEMGGGLFVARLDGSDRRLVAQLENWSVSDPVWSPDGKWMILTVTNTDTFVSKPAPALISLETCRAVSLAGIEGYVQGWVPESPSP